MQPTEGSTGRAPRLEEETCACDRAADAEGLDPRPHPPLRHNARLARITQTLREHFATTDLRTLALLRIVLGVSLMVDLWDRIRLADTLYSNDGVLSNHFALFRPLAPYQFSLYSTFSSSRDVTVAFVLTFIVYALFAAGYRTRLFHLLAFVCATSLHARNLMTELPSDALFHVLLGWSLLLPLGARFSIDSVRRPAASRRERPAQAPNAPEVRAGSITSFAVLGLLLQISAVHLVSALRQSGAAWQDGTAVYYALRENLWATDVGTFIGSHASFRALRAASLAYPLIEVAIGFGVLVPLLAARRAALLTILLFHLLSRALWNFGPYEWVMAGTAVFFVSSRDWALLERLHERVKATIPGPTQRYQRVADAVRQRGAAIAAWFGIEAPSSRGATDTVAFDDSIARRVGRVLRFAREGAAVVALTICGIALLRDLSDGHEPSGVELAVYKVVAYPRLFQRWGLFVPEPPRRPGMVVAEGQTQSGARVDPFTGNPSSVTSSVAAETHVPPPPSPLMSAYFVNIAQPSRSIYVGELRDYLLRRGEQRGAADKWLWFHVDWVEMPIAPPDDRPSSPAVAVASPSRRITSGP